MPTTEKTFSKPLYYHMLFFAAAIAPFSFFDIREYSLESLAMISYVGVVVQVYKSQYYKIIVKENFSGFTLYFSYFTKYVEVSYDDLDFLAPKSFSKGLLKEGVQWIEGQK